MQQGRRTASLKASYEAMSRASDVPQDFVKREGSGSWANAAAVAAAATTAETNRSQRTSKK